MTTERKVRVIRDPRDAKRDYFLPVSKAREMYDKGELGYDLTNETYTTKRQPQ